MRKPLLFVCAIALIGESALLPAHHAFTAEFDANKPVKLQGTVVKTEWINPHSWFHIDVKTADGRTERWMIEAGAPSALYRRGFNKNSLPIGTVILVTGYRAKDGALRANGRDITFQDGRRLFVGSSGTGAPYDFSQPPPKPKP